MENKKRTFKHGMIALFQISILIIGIVAFSEFASSQVTSSPMSTSIPVKKIIIAQTNQTGESSSSSNSASITGGFIWGSQLFRGIGKAGGNLLKNLLPESFKLIQNSFFWTLVAYGIVKIAELLGMDTSQGFGLWLNAIVTAALVGQGVISLTSGLVEALGGSATLASWIAWPVGIAVALFTFWSMFLRVDQRAVAFNCGVWQSKTGGGDCELCNTKEFPCTEYQCKSLGQACEIVNEGDDAKCVHKDPLDVTAPTITAREASLLSDQYSYEPLEVNGVEIKYNGGCLPAFEQFTFGVELDKIGTCKIKDTRTESFENMQWPLGAGLWTRNHTQMMIFPGQSALEQEGIELLNGGNYEYYVRCESVNGYSNREEFLFKFCIDPFPDTSAPTIYGFNFRDNTPIKYFAEGEAHETKVNVYTNEPAACSWSRTDKNYKDMENKLTCPKSASNFNAQLSYTCSGTLTGLENNKDNKFYFRCNDTSGNVNAMSKPLTLVGSMPLVIDSAGPSGTIKGSSNLVRVTLTAKTSAGSNNGKATCYYSTTERYDDYKKFEKTNSNDNSNDLYNVSGHYTYYIQCFDSAGNSDKETVVFDVESDFKEPVVVRAYKDGGSLKLVTNEEARCVYGTDDCSYDFDDGIRMTSSDSINHFTNWETNNNLYIKCRDNFGNEPISGCSIIVRPSDY
jgi:hypothetical protein